MSPFKHSLQRGIKMAENQTKPIVVNLPKPPQPNAHNETGVVKVVGDSAIPREYITPGWDIHEAIVRTHFDDENQVNDITRLYDWLEKFHVDRGIETLRFWCNARRSINSKGLIYALMAHVQIIASRALGVKLSKSDMEDYDRMQKNRSSKDDEKDK